MSHRFKVGDVVDTPHGTGVICDVDNSNRPYRVGLPALGGARLWFHEADVKPAKAKPRPKKIPNSSDLMTRMAQMAASMPLSGNTFTAPYASSKKCPFKKGDRVRHIMGGEVDVVRAVPGMPQYDSNNFWEADTGFLSERNGWCRWAEFELVEVKEQKKKEQKLDLSKLDDLIIEESSKKEISALLLQHKHTNKLFDEWGLGETIEYGKGMTLLFYGPPGTGKTWGATCIAKALGKELLTIGAAEIQTSEPGGANRNIQNAFKAAKEENKVLFIDECDSLIANRAQMGMILAGEINTLLTEIERSEEVVILATNMIENMDAALERRIQLIVEFPLPSFEQRVKIWQKLIPAKMPLSKDVKIELLAEHSITGGLIKNIVLQTARLALAEEAKEVSMSHFLRATERTVKSQGLMGKQRVQYGPGVQMGVSREVGRNFLDGYKKEN